MDKIAIDPTTVARHAAGGMLMGGSTAALISLLHSINLRRRQQKELRDPDESDENTIVIRLPGNKHAAVSCDEGMPVSVKHVDKPKASNKRVPALTYRKGYYKSQPMLKTLEKAADWQTLAASILGATGGGILGYKIIDSAYQRSVQRKLKEQERAARQEMLNAMLAKSGSVLSAFDLPMDKEAREKSRFSYLDAPFAVAALMTLLGSGGTAYITKKVLDSKLEEQQKAFKPPKVQRIVFKSATAAGPDEVQATPDDLECVQASVAVAMDMLDTERKLASCPDVKAELDTAGQTMDQLYKWAQQDVDPLIAYLQSNPKLRRALQRAWMEQHPVLRHFKGVVDLPGISHIADKKLYGKTNELGNQIGGLSRQTLKRIVDAFGVRSTQAKTAGFVLPSFVGSVLAEKAVSSIAGSKPATEPAEEELSKENVQEILRNIQLSATDPKAAAYLEANQEKIRALLGRMAMRGTI